MIMSSEETRATNVSTKEGRCNLAAHDVLKIHYKL